MFMNNAGHGEIRVGKMSIGAGHRPFIIAEMSGNHNGSLERALKLVDAAGASGVQALKLQTYTADTMTLPLKTGEFFIDDPKSLWNGRTLHDLYQEAHTPWDWHAPIFKRARELGMIAFSTPFDRTAVDFLEKLEVPLYKIASFENTDTKLIEYVAKKGKPMIISTGMASVSEIELAVQTARQAGCKDLILLKCTSSYPATPESSNLATIANMRELFGCQVGLSDHTMGIGAAVAACALGATVVEKHFTLDRNDGGVDSKFSLEPQELKSLVTETEIAWHSVGKVQYGADGVQSKSLQFRRTLYVSKMIKKGEVLSEENVRAVRPGYGLAVKYFDMVIGKHAAQDLPAGTPVSWSVLNS
jgi:pseudaminic acid synthase